MEISNHYINSGRGDLYIHKPSNFMKPKICIIGHGRSGKDTVAEILCAMYGFTFQSSSMAAAKIFIYDELKDKYGYESFDECYRERHNNREEWFRLITRYNSSDPSRLARNIMQDSDIYVGMRSRVEIEACKRERIFDLTIWVDAALRIPEESSKSFNIGRDSADIIIDNNSSHMELIRKVRNLGVVLSGELFIPVV
jgi:hypothetical protein